MMSKFAAPPGRRRRARARPGCSPRLEPVIEVPEFAGAGAPISMRQPRALPTEHTTHQARASVLRKADGAMLRGEERLRVVILLQLWFVFGFWVFLVFWGGGGFTTTYCGGFQRRPSAPPGTRHPRPYQSGSGTAGRCRPRAWLVVWLVDKVGWWVGGLDVGWWFGCLG